MTILHKTKCGVLYLFSSFMLYRKAVILVICFGVGDAMTGGDLYAVSYKNDGFSFSF